MDECYRFIVTGRVQGVYFRQSARERAVGLGLTGWVRNRPDGSVQGAACGAPASLQQFAQWLHHGPSAARVDRLEWELCDEQPGGSFEIRR